MSLRIISKCFEMFFTTFRTRIYPYLPRAWSSIREAEEGMGVTKSLKFSKTKIDFSWFVHYFFTHHLSSGAESAISSLMRYIFPTLASSPDSSGDISALRRSWKVFLGSKFAYSSSTFRKTKQLMVLATSEKVIPKCEKNHHFAKPPCASLR